MPTHYSLIYPNVVVGQTAFTFKEGVCTMRASRMRQCSHSLLWPCADAIVPPIFMYLSLVSGDHLSTSASSCIPHRTPAATPGRARTLSSHASTLPRRRHPAAVVAVVVVMVSGGCGRWRCVQKHNRYVVRHAKQRFRIASTTSHITTTKADTFERTRAC